MAPSEKITDEDLYEILGILPSASDPEVKKAYRKKALKCHPDKNPDNPKAAEEWEKLSKALEILTSQEARAAYDKLLKARKTARLRNRELESKRRKIKEDLESREAAYKNDKESAEDAARKLAQEIKRLREEGSKIVFEEQEILKQQVKEEETFGPKSEETPKLKVKWKAKKSDPENGGYSYVVLRKCFEKYGEIINLVVSQKRNGSAIVEFARVKAAELAIAHESGLPANSFQLSWLSGKPTEKVPDMPQFTSSTDFEKEVLERMKQAQRRKESEDLSKDIPSEDRLQSPSSHETMEESFILEKLRTAQKLKEESKHLNPTTESFVPPMPQAEPSSEANFHVNSSGKFSGIEKLTAEARDLESLGMRKLRQAEERRKLIQQMQEEDG